MRTQGNGEIENDAVLAQAAEWLMRLHAGDMTADDLAACQRWLAQSESHKRAFQRVADLREKVGQIRDLPWPTPEELSADRYEGQVSIEDWLRAQADFRTADDASAWKGADRNRRQPRWLWPVTLAASLVVVTTAGLWFGRELFNPSVSARQFSVETDVGEHRDLTLPDGSAVSVGARSKMSVRFTDTMRSVQMEEGAAYFTVVHDATRPFVVRAGAGTITAMGTAFNVQHLAGRVVVTVVEGGVEVASIPATRVIGKPPAALAFTRVQAGEQLVYGEALMPVRAADPAMAVAWRSGYLKYRDEPLEFVIPDVERYTRKRLVIADESVGRLNFTGTVFQDQVDDWLKGLETSMPQIDVIALNGHTVVLKARRTSGRRPS